MNHKRGRPKTARAGCLRCKPHKAKMLSEKWLYRRQQLRNLAKWREARRTGETDGSAPAADGA